ncbi:14773_t:CDS:2 [Funneliformis caledonium]|uniref:14773_t:CDS:1 n=1 Tax=Funneliformis caledonium TaxID=1117310 RepID=A0A9N9GN96_9GLOM|nr:14773_t:CDS:2 [Funneliformis caledonium]
MTSYEHRFDFVYFAKKDISKPNTSKCKYRLADSNKPQETILDFKNNSFLDKTRYYNSKVLTSNQIALISMHLGIPNNRILNNGNEDIKESLKSDYVEDILYKYAKDFQYEVQLHSFIIDTSNDAIMDLFKDVDHDYIITYNTSSEPELSDKLINYLMRYYKFQPNEM